MKNADNFSFDVKDTLALAVDALPLRNHCMVSAFLFENSLQAVIIPPFRTDFKEGRKKMQQQKHTNRLVNESSPYLLAHSHNPVNWYPWCQEAFEKARQQDKPVFLSIGYSSCHWCHVMEEESFSREDVAEILNNNFISVKVDREERPDIDDIYMIAATLITRRGGWPNSVWLTPERKPFYVGAYYPREDSGGMMGFKSILGRLAELWQNNRQEVSEQSEAVADAMKKISEADFVKPDSELSEQLIEDSVKKLLADMDMEKGGVKGAPKFPPHQVLSLLIRRGRRGDKPSLDALNTTLDNMARGGIYDHIGGGFHRYSTDEKWLVPHFEKMLSDNAQLAGVYADAFALTKKAEYESTAREVLDWALREMRDQGGAFYSALDADSEGVEGKYYLWTYNQIEEVLGKDRAKVFSRVYGFEEGGNYRDETTGEKNVSNILHLKKPLNELAADVDTTPRQFYDDLKQDLRLLLEARNRRVRPNLDDKILADCNGLMIAALAKAGDIFGESEYIKAGETAADFILTNMRIGERIAHSFKAEEKSSLGFLDDQVFMIAGMLELYKATDNKRWLDNAVNLTEVIFSHYSDGDKAFYNTADDQELLLVRVKEPYDKAVPSGNGVAAAVLLKLADVTGKEKYRKDAENIVNYFRGLIEKNPVQTPTLLEAAHSIV